MSKQSFTRVDFDKALASVAPRVRMAFEESHKILQDLNIPHIVIGGLAVNAHGYHYSTHDVDYLVTDEDVFDGSLIVTHKPGIPFKVGGVSIDYLSDRSSSLVVIRDAYVKYLQEARTQPGKLLIASDWLLVWMKLNVNRAKDRAAVVGMIHAGLDVDAVEARLVDVGDMDVLKVFKRCSLDAEMEER